MTNPTFGHILLTDTSNQIFTPTNPNYGYTIPNVSINTSFVLTDGIQTINNLKTFTNVMKWYASYLQLSDLGRNVMIA